MASKLLSDNFTEMHISITWQELHTRFGFNRREWEKKFRTFLSRQPRTTSELDAFIKFGTMHVNPVLNAILCRNGLHDTFIRMLEYIVARNSTSKNKPGVIQSKHQPW